MSDILVKRTPKLVKNFEKYKNLLEELVRKNIKLQYRGSILGLFWTLLQPLLTMIVFAFVFGKLFGGSKGVNNYPVYLLTGRLLYDFYKQGTTKSMKSIRGNAAIIKKVYVPKYLYPFSNVCSTFITFAISLIDLVLVIAFFNIFVPDKAIHFTWWILLSWVPIVVMLVLNSGVGMILATLNVYFRDMEYLYDVFCLILFYTTPIMYTLDRLKLGTLEIILKLNPLYGILQFFRACVINGEQFVEWWTHGMWLSFSYSVGFSLIMLLIGWLIFYKNQDKFILHI